MCSCESKLKNKERAGLSDVNPFLLPISFPLKHHRKARLLALLVSDAA